MIGYSRLAAIESAMCQYHEKYGHFPPAHRVDKQGRPAHSWRVLLLEFLDWELYRMYDFDQAWDSPANSRLADKMPPSYASTAYDPRHGPPPTTTCFVVIEGSGAAFDGAKTVSRADI